MDLAKAFDSVDHNVLLTKLQHYGVRGESFNWFKSYLSDRTQRVSCNGSLSNLQQILFGVPPLLFLLYINDLPNSSSLLRFILFADDSNAFLSHSSYDQLIKIANRELILAADWFKANKLSLNVSKTNFIVFRSSKKTIPIIDAELSIDNIIIPKVEISKFLGVLIDQHLKWNYHINAISKKIMKNTGIIKRISHLLPPQILKNLYYALIYPYLTYCNLIWTATYPSHLAKL